MKLLSIFLITLFIVSCNSTKKIVSFTKATILKDSAIANAHIGISIFDPSTNKYLVNYNAEKYFVPASNTKLFTCYAAMQYLTDSLVGLKYAEYDTAVFIQGTGDPTFMLDEFKTQRVSDFLQKINKPIYFNSNNWKEERWGSGWNWTDFNENYCQERSVMPMYYNSVTFAATNIGSFGNDFNIKTNPTYFEKFVNTNNFSKLPITTNAQIDKQMTSNIFSLVVSKNKFETQSMPFTTGDTTTVSLLQNNYNKKISISNAFLKTDKLIYSQPTDSLLKPMMHSSDNFFAEQSLLMVSNQKLGYMNDAAIIDYVKKNDFNGMPQLPRWVDGSGLSRYNMATPQSLVWLLNKMKNQFGMERLKEVLPTGGEGTLSSLYKNIAGKIFAKTGTLSNHAALSGFLYTQKGKLLIFSILTSGYQGSATPVRKAVEKYLQYIQKNN